jgi:two-component system nitrate/nitrite response regulator NarL
VIRILLVDDHTLFRRGLLALLAREPTFSVVGEAGDAGEAQRRAAELQPDVVLLDNHMPGVRGIDAIGGIHEAAPAACIIVLTVSEDEDDLTRALTAGAAGYLLKTVESDVLVESIRRLLDGEAVVSPEMTHKLVSALRAARTAPGAAIAGQRDESLSPREREILREIASGSSNKVIARKLDIAETTVKVHVQHILRKLNLSSRVQAAVFAVERGIS